MDSAVRSPGWQATLACRHTRSVRASQVPASTPVNKYKYVNISSQHYEILRNT